ncbi:hypothetical protein LUX12_12140 [Streptomyces somaliensis]|uniref:hypothetical protein n=1 Tax=Streptomyces somaliensis TaxID=78355 RepID=UPI0020CD380A|nr:hypothetical protein [Streptomyces somaliensis]MCP9945367.1 hypothetical protein [Streptomyces somaliensis]MCP9961427.1 hypothetical protein [Streptomyces somaliensis]
MTRTRARPGRIGVRPAEEVESAYRSVAARAPARWDAVGGPAHAPGRHAPRDTGRAPEPGLRRERPRQGAGAGGAGAEPPDAVREGVAAAYRWALAREGHGPVTGVPTREVPALWRLTAEADAAAVLLDDPVCPPRDRAYAQGVHDALAWLCGQSDDRAV